MDNLQLLERLGAVEPPDEAAVLRATEMLEAEISRTWKPAPSETVVAKSSPRPFHRRLLLRVAVAAVLVAAALGVTTSFLNNSSSAAASVLRHLARVASAQSRATVPGPGKYLLTQSETSFLHYSGTEHGYTYFQIEREQIWASPNRDGEMIQYLGSPIFRSEADKTAWIADGEPAIPTGTSASALGPDPLYSIIPNLPTNPVALGERITSRSIESGPPGPAEDFVQVGDLLRETDASPALRAALFDYAATIPGVVALGTVKDHSGRSGVGLSYVNDGLRTDLIFDPTTSVLLGEDETIEAGSSLSYPVGTIFDWTVYLGSSVADSMPSIASLPEPPPPPVTIGAPAKKV
jgi:hypothetical protein